MIRETNRIGTPRLTIYLGAGLTLLALAARVWRLDGQSMWWDEGVSVYLTTVGPRGLTIAKDFAVDLHPPAYYALLGLWRGVFGPSVWSDRLLSVFAGTVTVPVVLVLTRRVAGQPRSALVPAFAAALLAAVSPIDVYYSQEIRMYPLLPLLGGASLLATLNVFERGSRRAWVQWTVLSAFSLYVYYYLGLLVAGESLALTLVLNRRQALAWTLAQAAVLLAISPWLTLMALRLNPAHLALPPQTEVHLSPLDYLKVIGTDFTLGFDRPPAAPLFLAAWTVAVILGVVWLGRHRRDVLVLALAALAIPMLGAYAILQARPFFYPRFILFALVPLWALAGVGLTSWRRVAPLGLLAVLALVTANVWVWRLERITPRVGYAPDDYRTIFTSIGPEVRPGDVVVGGYPWQAGYVDAYLGGLGARGVYAPGPLDVARLDRLAAPGHLIWWYTYAPEGRFTPGEIEATVKPAARILYLDQYGDSRAALIDLATPNRPALRLEAPRETPIATLGGEIALSAADYFPRAPHPGSLLTVDLRWLALRRPSGRYTVFVHLLGPDGRVRAQHDAPPLAGAAPTDQWDPGESLIDRYALTVPRGAAPGPYQIEVGLYRPENGQRLVVNPPQPDNRIIVGAFTLSR